jgi:RNA polymerase sigma-70 factor, ECF subfamily
VSIRIEESGKLLASQYKEHQAVAERGPAETMDYGFKRASQPQASDLSEVDAIRLAQEGDAAAFERLYELHRGRVYGLCLRMVNNPTDAEDLTQDAFLQSFRKIHTFRGEAGFSTWLHRLTVNVVLMRFRRKSLVDGSIEEMTERDDESERPRREFGERDLRLSGVVDRLILQRALAQLPPGYRLMFLLHDVEGYEHQEIARLIGCSIGNSKSQLHKARLRLRQLLRDTPRNGERQKRKAARRARSARVQGYALECVKA